VEGEPGEHAGEAGVAQREGFNQRVHPCSFTRCCGRTRLRTLAVPERFGTGGAAQPSRNDLPAPCSASACARPALGHASGQLAAGERNLTGVDRPSQGRLLPPDDGVSAPAAPSKVRGAPASPCPSPRELWDPLCGGRRVLWNTDPRAGSPTRSTAGHSAPGTAPAQ